MHLEQKLAQRVISACVVRVIWKMGIARNARIDGEIIDWQYFILRKF